MKILFLARLFYPHIGGVEKHVLEISKRLLAKGHEVTIITEQLSSLDKSQKETGDLKKLLPKLEVYRIPVGNDEKNKKFLIWKWMWKHQKLLHEADIIHAHDVFFWFLPFRFWYIRKKVFTTFHGYEGYPITRKSIVIRKLSEMLSRGNICIGDFIRKWYGTNPTYISYGAAEEKNHMNKTPKSESAVFIGRLDDQTGIDFYTKAYTLLKKDLSQFDFMVVGDGPFEKKLPHEITIKGFEAGAEKYFERYHFAFTSRYLSMLEAMLAKRLVIATYDNPIKKDYLTLSPFSRFMVIAKSPIEIAEAVAYYLSHPNNEKDHIEKAYTWAKEQTWEKMVDLYLKLWSK